MDIMCTQNLAHVWLRNVNYWKSESSSVSLSETMPNMKCPHPLHRRKLRLAYVPFLPYVIASPKYRDGVGGIETSILRLMQEKFRFEIVFKKTSLGNFDKKSGKWLGRYGLERNV